MTIDTKNDDFIKKAKSISIRLSDEDYNKLMNMSIRTEIPISQIIRSAIKLFFKLDMFHIN